MFQKREDPSLERFFALALNEPTVGMVELQKDIKFNVPQDLAVVGKVKKSYEDLILAVPDIENTISELRNMKKALVPCGLISSHIETALKLLDLKKP
jgi:hypothetical protein